MTWSNALSRFIICPLVVALGDWVFAGVQLPGWTGWIIVGFVLAAAGTVMDMTLLDRLGHVGSFVTDTAVATVVIWGAQFFLAGSFATWGAALGTGLLLGLSEVVMHRWVQASRRRGVRQNRP